MIDQEYLEILKNNIDDIDNLKHLSVFSRRMYSTRTIGHWELYKKIYTLPGDIVELGVYKGETLLNFARFMEILNPGDREKKVIGFDSWKGLRDFTDKDGEDAKSGNFDGGWNPENFLPDLRRLIDLFHKDSFVPQKPRIHLVDGDIRKTAADYVEKNPGLRISLLHFDCDMYEPTLEGLKALYPLVVTGGIILFDEYGCTNWPGESQAVDDYFEGKVPKMKKIPFLSTPGGYFRKK